MIAAAYGYASDGTYSAEIEAMKRIDRFGVHAVYGRPHLYEREMRQMIVAQNVISAYKSRSKATTWSAWVQDNPVEAELLHKAQQAHEQQ